MALRLAPGSFLGEKVQSGAVRGFTFLTGLVILTTAALLHLAAGPDGASAATKAPPPGRRVDIGGYHLHLHCTGNGRPTVVLLSGMGDTAAIWDRVQPGVSRFTRVCSYDRAGEGASEPSPARASLQQTVNELHRLLLNAEVRSPHVLVGASWGGLIARVYASQHPERVAGMVFVDSTHEDTRLGINGKLVRPRFSAPGSPLKADFDLVYDSRENRPHPLGDMPLIVLTQGKAWNEERKRLQGDLAQLSRNSKLIIAEESGHHIHRDDPELVIRAIREVVEAVRRRARLTSADR